MPGGIIIFGPNGSGKTTLAREVARLLRCKHMDIEDYYFAASPIPYTAPRLREAVLRLMLSIHPIEHLEVGVPFIQQRQVRIAQWTQDDVIPSMECDVM